MLRFAYDTNGFAHHRLEDAIAILRDLGYDGIGLTPDVHHADPYRTSPAEWDALRRRLEGLDVVIQTGARFLLDSRRKHEPTLLANEPEGRARRLDFLERCVDAAQRLGARAVSFWSGRRPQGASDEQCLARLADGCRRLAERAASRGVALAFEPEPGMWIERVAEYGRLRGALGAGAPRLALDVGHLACTGERLDQVLATRASEIEVVQIEDIAGGVHEHRMFGEGSLDFPAIFRAFANARFEGVLEAELSRDSHRAPECAAEGIRRLRAWAREIA